MRTVSSLESMNSQIGRSFQRHANIFKFIESLKMHEFMKSSEMKLILNTPERSLRKKHKTDREREEKIKFFTTLLKRKEVDIGEFLEAMANKAILPSAGAFHIFKFAHIFQILIKKYFLALKISILPKIIHWISFEKQDNSKKKEAITINILRC